MRAAADELEFERAARLRDRLDRGAQGHRASQQMVAERNEDLDVIGIADDDLEAAVQVFFVRQGRVVGRKGFIVDKVEDLTPGELVDRILEELYGDEPPLGRAQAGAGARRARRRSTLYEEWLAMQRGLAGARSGCPQRGDKRELHETVTRNAKEEFTRHRLRRAARPQQPGPGPQRAAGRASACPRPRCASSATT